MIGLFDENLRAGDMIEWKGKMEKNNLPIKKISFVSANRRIHNSNYGRLNKAGEYKDYASILRAKILSDWVFLEVYKCAWKGKRREWRTREDLNL